MSTSFGANLKHIFKVTCVGPDGVLKWEDKAPNIVVTVGKNDILDKYYAGSSYTAANYLGLISSSPTLAAGDTMASHGGWTEISAYSSPSTRPAPSWSSASSGSKTVSAASAFTMNGSTTIGGVFICTSNTISATTGILIAEAALTGGNQAVNSGDVVNVTPTATV